MGSWVTGLWNIFYRVIDHFVLGYEPRATGPWTFPTRPWIIRDRTQEHWDHILAGIESIETMIYRSVNYELPSHGPCSTGHLTMLYRLFDHDVSGRGPCPTEPWKIYYWDVEHDAQRRGPLFTGPWTMVYSIVDKVLPCLGLFSTGS